MNNRVLISVIVPVYNTSQYINKCIQSLVNQSLNEIEIILVDDGSTDDSGAICDRWGEKDSRIKIIHQKNSGSAMARQRGLDSSIGEYVIICDSDDWVDATAYEKAYKKAKEDCSDIVFFGYVAEYKDGRSEVWNRKFTDLNNIELTRQEIMNTSWFHSWNKLFKRTLFKDYDISYTKGINVGEDALILQKLLCIRPLKISWLEESLYHYRISTGGYTTQIKPSFINQLLFVYEWVKKSIDNIYHQTSLIKSASDIAFESFRCNSYDTSRFNNIVAEIPITYLYSTPRSPQKLITLIGKLFGWKAGKLAYKYLLPILLR